MIDNQLHLFVEFVRLLVQYVYNTLARMLALLMEQLRKVTVADLLMAALQDKQQ